MRTAMEEGAYQAIHACLKVQPDESVVIISDLETIEIAASLAAEAKKASKKVRLFIAEDFGNRPLKSAPKELIDSVTHADVGILAMQAKEGELENFRKPILDTVKKGSCRFANMINITRTIMEQGMNADYQRIQKFSKKIYSSVEKALQIYVKTKSGTDFITEFSSDIRWIVADGIIAKGEWSNLPDGEVYTCPANVNGKIIIDGILGDYFAKKYGAIEKCPLYVEVKNGKVVKASCHNTYLLAEFNNRIALDENASRIGEFAIGTNTYLKGLIGNLLQDEKYPGVHIAFGHGYPDKTGSRWNSKIHLDAVLLRPTVFVDGKKLMEEGVFL